LLCAVKFAADEVLRENLNNASFYL
jgi:hypothetical protein